MRETNFVFDTPWHVVPRAFGRAIYATVCRTSHVCLSFINLVSNSNLLFSRNLSREWP